MNASANRIRRYTDEVRLRGLCQKWLFVCEGTLCLYSPEFHSAGIFDSCRRSIVRKAQGREVALSAVRRILMGLELCQVDRVVIYQALESNLKDFEDGVQFACARLNQLDAIVTRDLNDFLGVALPVWSIADLMMQL